MSKQNPALAGPAFVAALLGDRVRSVFLVAGKLMAVVDVTVPAGDAVLVGQPLEALARDYQFLPVRCCRMDGTRQTMGIDNSSPLSPGDKLTIIIELIDLQRLLRREAPTRT